MVLHHLKSELTIIFVVFVVENMHYPEGTYLHIEHSIEIIVYLIMFK